MNIYTKMITVFHKRILYYYKSLDIGYNIYSEDMDYKYIISLKSQNKAKTLSSDDKLFLIRQVLSKKSKDKNLLKKITLMIMNDDDKEMNDLAEVLIKNIYDKETERRRIPGSN